ncbi:hypothetical protein F4677DRAFT_83982 [Hypoxylon crocopeplum]|nr:hypothetical protein F4677DRAFT_83982 [Hypoxylon crocopeplum]
MACNASKLVSAAETRNLDGGNESQDSYELLERYFVNHGVGVLSSSPAVVEPLYQLEKGIAEPTIESSKTNIKTTRQPQVASDAFVEVDAANDSSKQLIQPQSTIHSSVPRFSRSTLTSELREPDPAVAQSLPDDATAAVERLSGNNVLPAQLPASALKKLTAKMSSDSPTQSNDGRSYEQYADDNSQPQSPSQTSSVHEHRTLHEEDTGFLNFKPTQYDAPESVSEDVEMNITSDAARRSQLTSQLHRTNGHLAVAPETPAVAQRLFHHGGDEVQLMAASQLFRQTQGFSTVKKASPTSSRPSPDVFNQNTISPNPIVSSPLKNRGLRTSPTHAFTSSPAFPGISSRPSDDKTSSVPTDSREDEGLNQESVTETPRPRFAVPRRRNVLEPISEYRSLRMQSLEAEVTNSLSQSGGEQDSDSEIDIVAYRRRQAKMKQERASKSFPSVSLPRSSVNKGENVEVPSTSRSKSVQDRRRTDAEQYLAQGRGKSTDNNGSQETVADSQEATVQPPPSSPTQYTETRPKTPLESNEQTIDNRDSRAVDLPNPPAPASNVENKETIPETSPPGTSVEPPKLLGDLMRQQSSIRSEVETVSFPSLSNNTEFEQLPKGSNEPRPSSLPEPLPSIPANLKQQPSRGRPLRSSPSVVPASSPQSTTRQSARLRSMVTPLSIGDDSLLLSEPRTGTSTLTSLSATPKMSSSITPSTEPNSVLQSSGRSLSPAAAKVRRRGRPPSSLPGPSSSLPKIKAYSRPRESVRRLTRHSSMSTDELIRSPLSVTGPEGRKPPIQKPARQSTANQHLLRESTVKRGIFEGMAFALSFQGGQIRKSKDKAADRTTVENMIRQEGGKILPDGFDELFKFDSFQAAGIASTNQTLSSSLTLLDQDTGFAALIADGHSRKVKYMQALALGIPCLAPRWIMNCISKREIVDWSSYLLCAGPSMLLGEAIRSRNLQPYDASTAKLADVIDNRPKLLDAAEILLVMKKTKNEEKRLPYMFLAQVLGGSLVRVNSVEEARVKLREKESQGQPFDWVYVDDHLHNSQNALFGTTGDTGPKKRKRQSTGSEEPDRPPKRIRTLNDELVIQSLILGRLIEDGEMEE